MSQTIAILYATVLIQHIPTGHYLTTPLPAASQESMSSQVGELTVRIIPLLTDNYCYLVGSSSHRKLLIIDPSEAAPVNDVLKKEFSQYKIDKILLTHHHHDHVGGAQELATLFGCKIYCSDYDLSRLPFANFGISTAPRAAIDNKTKQPANILARYTGQNFLDSTDDFDFCGEKVEVLFIPGHTLGHIAYYFTKSRLVFTGDTLFSAGCGKLFEGSPEQMFMSLKKLARLPIDTKVYCGHEYTVANLKFAISLEPENLDIKTYISAADELRRRDLPTVPSTIGVEKMVNPFVRAKSIEELRDLRLAKDNFKG